MQAIAKIRVSIMLGTLLLCSNGCTTYNTVQYAQGYPENATWFTFQTRGTNPKPQGDHKPHPAYYLLTPLTVPVDIVTLPIQFVDFWYVLLNGFGYQ